MIHLFYCDRVCHGRLLGTQLTRCQNFLNVCVQYLFDNFVQLPIMTVITRLKTWLLNDLANSQTHGGIFFVQLSNPPPPPLQLFLIPEDKLPNEMCFLAFTSDKSTSTSHSLTFSFLADLLLFGFAIFPF